MAERLSRSIGSGSHKEIGKVLLEISNIRYTEKWQSGCPEASGAADKIYGEMAERLSRSIGSG
jgi:hypothetical protein